MGFDLRKIEIPQGSKDERSHQAPARERLDRFLAEALGVSRAEARRLLDEGAVLVNGQPVGRAAKSRPLSLDDRVQMRPRSGERGAPLPEPAAPLDLLARGPGWVAVDKPAGRPVHPYRADERGSVLGALVAREPGLLGVGEGGLRSGVVHRLDVETSGALLVALEQATWERARAAFAAGRVSKRYRAVVSGCLEGSGEMELDLYVARHRPARVRVAAPGTARRTWRATLRWRALEALADATLLEVAPQTGFLHQIRVSLAELGHPVLGDRSYGGVAVPGLRPARHLLHAAFLEVPTLAGMRAQSPDPADFRNALAALRPDGA